MEGKEPMLVTKAFRAVAHQPQTIPAPPDTLPDARGANIALGHWCLSGHNSGNIFCPPRQKIAKIVILSLSIEFQKTTKPE
jgi:hypothetical protein